MAFDEEWSALRARATEQQGTAMRLNSAENGPLPGIGGQKDLASTPAEKKAAANTIETELEPSTKKATVWADESSATTVKEFDGWDTGAGLKKVMETWDKQVKVLMGRLASEKGSLRGTSTLFSANDLEIKSQFTPLLKPLTGPYASGLNGL